RRSTSSPMLGLRAPRSLRTPAPNPKLIAREATTSRLPDPSAVSDGTARGANETDFAENSRRHEPCCGSLTMSPRVYGLAFAALRLAACGGPVSPDTGPASSSSSSSSSGSSGTSSSSSSGGSSSGGVCTSGQRGGPPCPGGCGSSICVGGQWECEGDCPPPPP